MDEMELELSSIAGIVDEMELELSSISSTIPASSNIGGQYLKL
jgi:hypothetical protein